MVIWRELITPDGTRLVSHHRHDYVSYTDKNGKTYMLDGGHFNEYFRCSCNGDEKFLEITTEFPFSIKRKYFERYNTRTRKPVKLKDISSKWLENIIDYYIDNNYYSHPTFLLFIEEKLFRNENEIYIPE